MDSAFQVLGKMTNLAQRIWHFDWRSAFIAAPFAVVLAYVVNGLIDRMPPITYEHARAPSVTSVPQGSTIDIEFTVFRHRICEGKATRWLTDSEGVKHSIPSFTVGPRVQLAGLDTYRRTITIPESAALGIATYTVEIDYACNIIHRLGWPIHVVSPPIRFEITPRPLIIIPPILPEDDDG